jgi:dephospho-CoA kinase
MEMILIGIAGGIASGKSLVSSRFEAWGARLLDADAVGHEVLREQAVKQAIRDRWGDGVLDNRGEIDRAAVARIVFATGPHGQRELRFLENLTHPRIKQRLREQLERWSHEGRTTVAVLDAPLLFKSGWNRECDWIVFVDAPRAVRLARARQRGWTEAEFESREAAQQTLETKRRQADVVIDNSTTLEHLYEQIDRFWLSLVRSDSGDGIPAGDDAADELTTKTRTGVPGDTNVPAEC